MKFFIALIFATLTYGNNAGNKFINYNRGLIGSISDLPVIFQKRFQYYINEAAKEESKNPDKVILYHGESITVWLFQEYLKQLMNPNAMDWLPMRFSRSSRGNVDAQKLMRIPQRPSANPDHTTKYTKIGMAAHVNLISHNTAESAWGYALIERSPLSSKFGGLSLALDHSFKSLLKSILPQRRWLIEKQFNATLNYIGRRRGISNSGFVEHNYGRLFPKMSFQDISKVQNEALSQTYKDYEMVLEGVILQIIMNQTEAERYCYAAHPYGYVYSKDHKLFGSEWKTNDYNGEAIDPFMTYYYDNKNKQDLLQTVRIALGKDFVKYPSRVKIKAISPLMQDEEAMRLVRLMIDEMVRQSRKVL